MKKILLLGDINSSHLIKWAISLRRYGSEICIFSLSKPKRDWYTEENIRVYIGQQNESADFRANDSFKLKYIYALRALKTFIITVKPDILHAHYASSYGLLGALSGFKNYYISVWGSDVFVFPRKSIFHRLVLRFNLAKARLIFSASEVMADETVKYTQTPIHVIPFGVDIEQFSPNIAESADERKTIVVGTVKSLEPVYAIDILIKAFAKVNANRRDQKLKLLIVGDGSLRNELEALARELQLGNVEFTGQIDNSKIALYHQRIDIFVNLSLMESFGVSVLEAMACGKPVIVSKVGGLAEITDTNCAIQVEPANIDEAERAIDKLISHPDLRAEMGKKGRKRIEEMYNWQQSVSRMMSLYNRMS